MRPLIALAIVAGFVACSAGLAHFGPSADEPSTSGSDVVHRELAAPEDRFSVLPLSFWESRAEDYGISAADDATYRRAIEEVRSGGFESPTDDERRLVIAVAWSSFAYQAETIRYRVHQVGGAPGLALDSVVDERYQFEDVDGASLPELVAMRVHLGEGSSPLSGAPESIMLVDFGPPDDENADISFITWTRTGDTWTCTRQSDDGTGGLAMAYYLGIVTSHLILEPALVRGNFVSTEEVDGTATYRIMAAPLPGDEIGVSATRVALWLDATTLLPRQYEEVDIDVISGEETGSKRLYTVLEVNGDVEIEPPDVNVECVERTSG